MKKLVKSNHSILPLLTISALLTTLAPSVQAESEAGYTNYVTDSIEIPFRSQPGYKYKILRMLRSGSKVTVVDVNEDGWAKLLYNHRGEDIEGWMPSILLQAQPIAREKVADLEKKVAYVEKQLNQIKLEKQTLQSRFDETDEALKSAKKINYELEKQLEEIKKLSGNAIQLNEDNRQMAQQIQKLENENTILSEQIDQSEDVVKRQWFLTGGGVLLLGLIIGRLFRMPGRRKWNTL